MLSRGVLRPLAINGRKWPSLLNKTKSTSSPISAAANVAVVEKVSGTDRPVTSQKTTSQSTDSTTVREEIERCYRRLDLSFEDTKEAFKSKSNWELWRQYIVLRLLGIDFLVQNNATAIAVTRRVLGKRLFGWLMQATFYGHFVAGENQESIKPVLEKLSRFGVKSILDYSVEADVEREGGEASPMQGVPDRREGVISARTYLYSGEPECDRNTEVFLGCIDAVAHTTDATGLAAIKLTALGRPRLLLQVSQAIKQTHDFFKILTGSTSDDMLLTSRLSLPQLLQRLREFGIKTDEKEVKEWFVVSDFDQDGYIDIYEWGHLLDHNLRLGKLFRMINLKTGKLDPLITNLTEEEERQFGNMMQRLNTIVQSAVDKNVRVMIDAEQTYFQPIINRVTIEFMRRFNKDKAVVFNTYQAYLKDVLTQIRIDLQLSKRDDFYFGAKLVRGAYMVQERKRAAELGYEDPINESIKATALKYNDALRVILQEVKQRAPGKVSIMCATHNEDAVRKALELMREHNIGPRQRIVCFGQLYAMCDQVTMILGQAGYSAYKYVPYGELEGVLPYLSRRAHENSSVLAKAKKERQLVWKEIKRRYLSGIWWYDPMKNVPVKCT